MSRDAAVVKKNIETCKQFVDLVADIGGRGVKVRPNGLPKAVPVDKTLEQIGKSLIPCGQAAADAGLEIWVEVHGKGTPHPAEHEEDHGALRPSKGRPDLELEPDGHHERLRGGVVQDALAVGPVVPHQRSVQGRPACTPTASCSGCFAKTGYDRVTLCEVGKHPARPR